MPNRNNKPHPQRLRPPKSSLPAQDVQLFRAKLRAFLEEKDEQGRKWSNAKWGIYAFYDYDGEPIYVGQTNEKLRTRIGRHLTNQRSDPVAMRILDVFEVAEAEMWPLWELEAFSAKDQSAKQSLDAYEYTAYLNAITASKFNAILNEKIPPLSEPVDMPPSLRWSLIDDQIREERDHPDIRIARRAETISRLAAVSRERGEVSEGLRRALVVQAVRLAYLAAQRLATAEGRPAPNAAAIDIEQLVGSVLVGYDDPHGESSDDDEDG